MEFSAFERISGGFNHLGECPVWSVEEQALYWVDILAPAVFRWDPSTNETLHWAMPDHIGSLALHQDGGLVVALRNGLFHFNQKSHDLTELKRAPYDGTRLRFNDGRCDRAGRFWVGSMNEWDESPTAQLYCYDGRELLSREANIRTSNGLAFSPDDRTLYFSDSPTRTIVSYDFSLHGERISGKRAFAELPKEFGVADGAAVDADGCYWITLAGASKLARFTPGGRLERVYDLPISIPTMCAFGGSNLETLFITSAYVGLTPAHRAAEPLAGALFAMHPGVNGIREPKFQPL